MQIFLKHRVRYDCELIVPQEKLPKSVVNPIKSVINREQLIALNPHDLHRTQSLNQIGR